VKNRHQPSIKRAISTLRIPSPWIRSNLRRSVHAQSIGKVLDRFRIGKATKLVIAQADNQRALPMA
jgi:hypothetical protein